MHSREILFIIELIFWPPTLGVALYVAYKQGFSRQLGWFSLCLLGVFRILGAATGIAAIMNPDNAGVIETSMICSSVGLISLVGALTGLIFRVLTNLPSQQSPLNPLVSRLTHLATLAALILSILAGSDFSDQNSPSDILQGQKFIKIAVGLLSAVFLVSGGFALFTRFSLMSYITAEREHRLVNATIIGLPFIATRLVYAWLGACLANGNIFGLFSDGVGATVVRAVMQIAPELIVAGVFLWAGLTVPKTTRQHHSGGINAHWNTKIHKTRGGRTDMLFNGFGARNGNANMVQPEQEQGVMEAKPTDDVREV